MNMGDDWPYPNYARRLEPDEYKAKLDRYKELLKRLRADVADKKRVDMGMLGQLLVMMGDACLGQFNSSDPTKPRLS